jgi:leader peptidase (prepilin peptidase)/N-methyltransferase
MTFVDFFATNPFVLAAITFAFGLVVGSFLNVVIYRLPLMMEAEWTVQCQNLLEIREDKEPDKKSAFNLAVPDSHCPHCKHKISALENIPVLSWLILKGKCRYCQGPISARYPLMELATGVFSALVAYHFGFALLTLAVLFLTWGLITLTMIDYDHQLLPDDITLPLLWLGLLLNSQGLIVSLEDAVYGAIAGYLLLWGVYWLFKLLIGKEGMGYGDFKLLSALGAWLGWQALPMIILLSSLVGTVVSFGLIAIRVRDRNIPIPFGPYLASAGFLSLIWGTQITGFYYSLIM